MPTVVVLDCSLSMKCPVDRKAPNSASHLSLAVDGITWFFDYLADKFPLEYTAVLSCSSVCKILGSFSRDYQKLKAKLDGITVSDKTDLRLAISTAVETVIGEWGAFVPCQIVVVTDGKPGMVRSVRGASAKPLLIPFPCQLHVVTLADPEELTKRNTVGMLCNNLGISPMDIVRPSGLLTPESVIKLFKQYAEKYFVPYHGKLICGELLSKISLAPSPLAHTSNCNIVVGHNNAYTKLDGLNGKFPTELNVCGFIDIINIHAPPVLSKHLVLDEDPILSDPESDTGAKPCKQKKLENGTAAENDESKKPSFRVLFHGSLKINNLLALIQLSKDWFGLLGSESCQGGRKSNLVLSVLYPGGDVPWLGQLSHLGLMPQPVDPRSSSSMGFPVSLSQRLSYQSPSNLAWVSDSVLQNDIAKVVRYSTKLPEKESSFIKEVNKLRLCALTFGFQELLDLLCNIFNLEKNATANMPTARLLDFTVHFLRTNLDPHQKLIPPPDL